MALDAALYECVDTPVFRLYTWEPSVTIGRFQDAGILTENTFPFSRRMTGGGVLLHGYDVSYSLIVPTSLLPKMSVKESYEYLCEFLCHFYKSLDLDVGYAKELMPEALSKSPFCQVGFEPYDMIINGQKVGGNAQKRGRDALLQHGSIPLFKDERDFSGASLEEIGVRLDACTCKEKLCASFARTYGIILRPSELSKQEQTRMNVLYEDYYNDEHWQRYAKKAPVASQENLL